MNTITFTPDSIALIDGEIYLTPNRDGKTFTWQGGQLRNFYATTNTSIPNVKHIERSKFVKPDFYDMEQAYIHEANLYDHKLKDEILTAFFDGYNSNKKEFTMEEMEHSIKLAFIHGQQNVFAKQQAYESIVRLIRPLSIPKSVICDQEFNVIEVKW